MFEARGLTFDEELMLMSVLEAGGEEGTSDSFGFITDPSEFAEVRDTLEN